MYYQNEIKNNTELKNKQGQLNEVHISIRIDPFF